MPKSLEWPTLALAVLCYAAFAAATTIVAAWSLPLAIAVTAVTVTLHASLTHEVVHGHPTRNERLNAALVFPATSLLVPFGRFRDTHLDHHMDADLTDPYDDPESNYLDPAVWFQLPRLVRSILRFNNTLLGRIMIGPLIGLIIFIVGEVRLGREGDCRVARAWLWHIPAVSLVFLWLVAVSAMPIWAYLVSVYVGIGLLRIRTFLEHQAHERASGRTVIIEDRGPLSLLFLNNNLHVVHHNHPGVPWYDLPATYAANRDRYVAQNGGYLFRSYGDVFRQFLLRAKDPVPHPYWTQGDGPAASENRELT